MKNQRGFENVRWREVWVFLCVLIMFPSAGYSEPSCVASALSDQQVKEIIDRGRAARTDLPKSFPRSRWSVRRKGCHYVYIEYGLPEVPDYNHVFTVNQHGAIVDAETAPHGASLKCPDEVLSERELAEVVRRERETRSDLPPRFQAYKTRVHRLRCLYLYFEYNLPERRGDYQVFTIDPFGELMEFSRSQPY